MRILIKNYIKLLTIERIDTFLKNNSINLNKKELEYIYDLIKTNWENILIDDEVFINDMYQNINKYDCDKIVSLIDIYKNKYKDLLF